MAAKTILVVDKDTITIKRIQTTLESAGFLVLTASNKFSGFHAAKELKPSIIFINIGIIGENGLAMCQKIHADKTLNQIPIVFITPQDCTLDLQGAIRSGRVEVLSIPFTTDELIAITHALILGNSGSQRQSNGKVFEHKKDRDIPCERRNELMDEGTLISKRIEEQQLGDAVTAHPVENPHDIDLGEKCDVQKESRGEKEEKLDIQYTYKESLLLKAFAVKSREEQERKHTGVDIHKPAISIIDSDDLTSLQRQDNLLSNQRSDKKRIFNLLLLMGFLIGIIGVGGFVIYGNFIQLPQKEESSSLRVQRDMPALQVSRSVQEAGDIKRDESAVPATHAKKPETKPSYIIQIGVFKVEANARSLRKQYRERGYDAHIKTIKTKNNGIMYKIFIGSFETREEAIEAARSISKKEKIKAIIVQR